jgi:hypothetical protein
VTGDPTSALAGGLLPLLAPGNRIDERLEPSVGPATAATGRFDTAQARP